MTTYNDNLGCRLLCIKLLLRFTIAFWLMCALSVVTCDSVVRMNMSHTGEPHPVEERPV